MLVFVKVLVIAVSYLDRRSQRVLLMCCTAIMAVLAGTSTSAARAGDYTGLAVGAVMLALMTVVSAAIWSARNRTRPPG